MKSLLNTDMEIKQQTKIPSQTKLFTIVNYLHRVPSDPRNQGKVREIRQKSGNMWILGLESVKILLAY